MRIDLSETVQIHLEAAAIYMGVTAEELATAAVTCVAEIPREIAHGLCLHYMPELFEEFDDTTDPIDETS
jgi:ferredoxin